MSSNLSLIQGSASSLALYLPLFLDTLLGYYNLKHKYIHVCSVNPHSCGVKMTVLFPT